MLSLRERQRLGRSESLLRESEEGWELAGLIAGIGTWSWDAASGELTLSRKARELFGLEQVGVIRMEDWLAQIHPDDVERIRRDTEHSMANDSSFERDYRILLPGGQVHWITSRGRVERDGAGKVTSMHGVSFDMTRTRRSDAMFRAALEAAPDALFLVDGQGRIQLANARASLLFGYPNEELLSLPMSTLVPEWIHHPEQRRAPGRRAAGAGTARHQPRTARAAPRWRGGAGGDGAQPRRGRAAAGLDQRHHRAPAVGARIGAAAQRTCAPVARGGDR
jgi:PAS domain-containing protein